MSLLFTTLLKNLDGNYAKLNFDLGLFDLETGYNYFECK